MLTALAALALAASCERAAPKTRASELAPAPAPAPTPPPPPALDAAVDAVAVSIDTSAAPAGGPVTTPERPLNVKPGELRFLVALRRAIAGRGGSKDRDDAGAVDLSGTAGGDPRALALAALALTVRIQLPEMATLGGIEGPVERLEKLPELRTVKDLEQLEELLGEIAGEASALSSTRMCESEGCPERVGIEPTQRGATALADVCSKLQEAWQHPASHPAWVAIGTALGSAINDLGFVSGTKLPSQKLLEQLAARAR